MRVENLKDIQSCCSHILRMYSSQEVDNIIVFDKIDRGTNLFAWLPLVSFAIGWKLSRSNTVLLLQKLQFEVKTVNFSGFIAVIYVHNP